MDITNVSNTANILLGCVCTKTFIFCFSKQSLVTETNWIESSQCTDQWCEVNVIHFTSINKTVYLNRLVTYCSCIVPKTETNINTTNFFVAVYFSMKYCPWNTTPFLSANFFVLFHKSPSFSVALRALSTPLRKITTRASGNSAYFLFFCSRLPFLSFKTSVRARLRFLEQNLAR